jgi:hypothetical protein
VNDIAIKPYTNLNIRTLAAFGYLPAFKEWVSSVKSAIPSIDTWESKQEIFEKPKFSFFPIQQKST